MSAPLIGGVRPHDMAEPTLTEWMQLSSDERARRLAALNAYAGEGGALVRQIVERFRDEFGHLPELEWMEEK